MKKTLLVLGCQGGSRVLLLGDRNDGWSQRLRLLWEERLREYPRGSTRTPRVFLDGLEWPNNECGRAGWLEGETMEREHK